MNKYILKAFVEWLTAGDFAPTKRNIAIANLNIDIAQLQGQDAERRLAARKIKVS